MDELNLIDLYDVNFYHVCTNGLERVTLLKDDEDYRTAWNYLAFSAWRSGAEVLVFALMSNHVHEILACKDASHADVTIKLYKKMLSLYLKNKYGMTKVLHNTSDCISQIDTVQYMKNCIAYILRNAMCARICAKPEEYRWSSYACYFSGVRSGNSFPISRLTFSQKRKILRTGMDLRDCPFRIDTDGFVTLGSFIRSDIVERIYRHSGKSFLYYLGCCNDARMEYELTCKPMMHVSDRDMYETVTRYAAGRFRGKELAELTSAEKCSILKPLFFQ